ncbi:MAG: class I SAM-dependent RNA methyltransferase, partial [Myxococcales bacterium]|nr:class I SAM-dependent RNA methyltransferase [Myxococcales bacterium]
PIVLGDRLALTIDRPAFGGEVIGHAPDGRVVFVRGAAPGDQVVGVVTEAKRRFLRLRAEQVDPGPDRVTPFCPHFDACGGCPWQAVPLAVQRETLTAHVARLLKAPVEPVRGVEPTEAWRSTARLHWQDGRLGYRAPGSRSLVEIDACPVLAPPLPALFAGARVRLAATLQGAGTLRLTGAPGTRSGTISVEPAGPLDAPAAQALSRALRDWADARAECHGARLVLGDRILTWGDAFDRFGAAQVPHPAGSFVQAHQPGSALMVDAVVEALAGARHVLELYAGAGNFTLALAAAGHSVTAVENDAAAVAALRAEVRSRGYAARVVVQHGDAARLPRTARTECDAALIDPPRAGAAAAVRALAFTGVERLVYVSCDAATLARDASTVAGEGFRLAQARPLDLFPHTGHVEVVAEFHRSAVRGGA